jgi:predicted amidohydrolase
MRVAAIQQFASPDREKNIRIGLDNLPRAADLGASLVSSSELAFEPFYPQFRLSGQNRAFAEPIPGPTTDTFQEVASRLGVVTVINLYERGETACYDSSAVIDADGPCWE